MKNLMLTTMLLLTSLTLLAQLEMTITGDPNDPKLIQKKELLESKGYMVKIKAAGIEEDVIGDKAFIEKWTDKQMPAFEFTDVNGGKVSSEELKGKYIHINFWSVTCKPCIQEFPELNDLKEKYGADFAYLAFAPESEKKVNKILGNNPLEYRTVADTKDFFDELGIGGYPKNFFIDPSGKIVKVTDGARMKLEIKDGKKVMAPDNFRFYDKIMQEMIASE